MRKLSPLTQMNTTRRSAEEVISTRLTELAHRSWILYHVFALKQCILCSALRHKCCLTLVFGTSVRDVFCLLNYRARPYLAAASQPRVFTRVLVGNYHYDDDDDDDDGGGVC